MWSFKNGFNSSNTLENAKLPVGINTITWTILDNNTNQTECTFIVTVNPHTTSIENVGDITISIFPNPTSGIFNIKTATKTSTIEIFDATG